MSFERTELEPLTVCIKGTGNLFKVNSHFFSGCWANYIPSYDPLADTITQLRAHGSRWHSCHQHSVFCVASPFCFGETRVGFAAEDSALRAKTD